MSHDTKSDSGESVFEGMQTAEEAVREWLVELRTWCEGAWRSFGKADREELMRYVRKKCRIAVKTFEKPDGSRVARIDLSDVPEEDLNKLQEQIKRIEQERGKPLYEDGEQLAVEEAIDTASADQLKAMLKELCSHSSALSKATLRILKSESDSAKGTLQTEEKDVPAEERGRLDPAPNVPKTQPKSAHGSVAADPLDLTEEDKGPALIQPTKGTGNGVDPITAKRKASDEGDIGADPGPQPKKPRPDTGKGTGQSDPSGKTTGDRKPTRPPPANMEGRGLFGGRGLSGGPTGGTVSNRPPPRPTNQPHASAYATTSKSPLVLPASTATASQPAPPKATTGKTPTTRPSSKASGTTQTDPPKTTRPKEPWRPAFNTNSTTTTTTTPTSPKNPSYKPPGQARPRAPRPTTGQSNDPKTGKSAQLGRGTQPAKTNPPAPSSTLLNALSEISRAAPKSAEGQGGGRKHPREESQDKKDEGRGDKRPRK